MKIRGVSVMVVSSILIFSMLMITPSVLAEESREEEGYREEFRLHGEILRRAGLEGLPENPRETMQRQEVASIIVDLMGIVELRDILGGECPDIEDSEEISEDHRPDVAALRATEVITGGEYRPTDLVTRVEVVTMLLRVLGEDPEEDAEFPLGPVMKAADIEMVDEWPGPAGEPADGEFIREVLAWVYRELNPPVAGLVADADDDSITISSMDGEGEEYDLASDLYVAGADSAEATRFQMVLAFENGGGDIGVIETAEKIESLVGEITAHRIENGRIRVGGTWVDISGLFLEINGMPFRATSEEYLANEADGWVEEGVEVAVHRSEDDRGFVSVFEYDLDPVAVLKVADEEGEVTFGYRGRHGYMEESVALEKLADVSVVGAVEDVGEIEEGDVLRIASFGGFGMVGDPPPEKIDVRRESIEIRPITGDYRKRRDEEGLRYIFEIDGADYFLDPTHFLGSVDDFLAATWTEVSVDRSRRLVCTTEILNAEDVDVGLFREVRSVDRGRQVILNVRGINLVLPVDPSVEDVVGELGDMSEVLDRFRAPTFNSDGMLTGLEEVDTSTPDLDDDGLPDDEVTVIGVMAEHDCCVIETDGGSAANSYHLLVDPWVVEEASGTLEVGELAPGSVPRLREISGTRLLLLD